MNHPARNLSFVPDEPRAKSPKDASRALLTTAVAVGAGVAGAHVGGDPGAVLAAGLGPATDLLFSRIAEWRARHVSTVIAEAADQVSMTAEQLLDRLLIDDIRGELAARVLIAAQDAGTEERLRALSRSLANGVLAEESVEIEIEVLYARALADLDSPHIHLLSMFSKTWHELGLSEDDTHPPDGLNYQQVSMASGLDTVLDPVLGVLVRHGLIQEHQVTGGMSLSGGLSRGQYSLTKFGRSLLERMEVLGAAESTREVAAASPDKQTEGDSCLVCGRPADRSLIPSSSHVEVSDPDDPSRNRVQALPKMPLCEDHVTSLITNRLAIGWCADCERWGEAGERSPCGVSYEPCGP